MTTRPPSLSDHTPLLIQFSSYPRPLARFHFSDMWTKHKDFGQIIASIPSPKIAAIEKLLGQAQVKANEAQ